MFLIHCTQCDNNMKYQPSKDIRLLDNPKKQCVYCGKSIKVKENIVKELSS